MFSTATNELTRSTITNIFCALQKKMKNNFVLLINKYYLGLLNGIIVTGTKENLSEHSKLLFDDCNQILPQVLCVYVIMTEIKISPKCFLHMHKYFRFSLFFSSGCLC